MNLRRYPAPGPLVRGHLQRRAQATAGPRLGRVPTGHSGPGVPFRISAPDGRASHPSRHCPKKPAPLTPRSRCSGFLQLSFGAFSSRAAVVYTVLRNIPAHVLREWVPSVSSRAAGGGSAALCRPAQPCPLSPVPRHHLHDRPGLTRSPASGDHVVPLSAAGARRCVDLSSRGPQMGHRHRVPPDFRSQHANAGRARAGAGTGSGAKRRASLGPVAPRWATGTGTFPLFGCKFLPLGTRALLLTLALALWTSVVPPVGASIRWGSRVLSRVVPGVSPTSPALLSS